MARCSALSMALSMAIIVIVGSSLLIGSVDGHGMVLSPPAPHALRAGREPPAREPPAREQAAAPPLPRTEVEEVRQAVPWQPWVLRNVVVGEV